MSALARMPAHHTTVAASSCSPDDSDTPRLLSSATLTPNILSVAMPWRAYVLRVFSVPFFLRSAMMDAIGLFGMLLFCAAVIALAAGITWVVVRFSPAKKPS